jgi:Co/Zn/Cd efflux system component
MDCASEEQLIRMRLESVPEISSLKFDLGKRTLAVTHSNDPQTVLSALLPLKLGAEIQESKNQAEDVLEKTGSEPDRKEGHVLKILLAINALMFLVEIIVGLIANSTGLIADSLDMFADAAVYGISLYAVGKASSYKRRAARYSGYLQLGLATMVIIEVVRRAFFGSEPVAPLMMGISSLSLLANLTCLALLSKHREGAVHMRASWIFSTNDVIANIGVILAGGLVYFTSSTWPDLVVGGIIAAVVLNGALKILKISSPPKINEVK